MKYNRMTRRMFLQGSGKTLLSIPVLTSLLPRELWAQTTSAPVKRFISVIQGYDMGHNSNWIPYSGANALNIPQPNRIFNPGSGMPSVRYQPLREFAPTNSSILSTYAGSAFSPYLESMSILRSLDFCGRYGHGGAQILGGITGDVGLHPNRGVLSTIPTIDNVINNHRGFNPAGLPLINCGNTGVGPDNYSYASVGGVGVNATSVGEELLRIYNQLFANGTLPENGGSTTAHPKYNILTRVLGDYTRVRNSRNISASDRTSLDNTLDKLSDVQRSLTRVSTSQCSHLQLSKSGSVYQIPSNASIGRALADMITAAIMCDSARVFTIGAASMGGLFQGQADDHDTISHNPFATISGRPSWQISGERHAAMMRNFVAPLIQNLSGATDPSNSRSYLYNSLIYSTTESGQVHGWGSHPVTLFGNAGGALTSGNYIDYSDRTKGAFEGADSDGSLRLFSGVPGSANFSNNWYGTHYNRLLVTILQSMGLTPTDYVNDTLNRQLYNRSDIGIENRNLTSLGGYGYAYPFDLTGADPASWGFQNYVFPGLSNHDLRQFRNPLLFPA